SWSLSAQDSGEPNNDFNNAHLIGFEVVINALISQSGDDDYYELDIEEPGVIEVEVLQVPGNIDLDLYVYGPGQEINEIGVRDGYLNGESFTYRVSTCQVGAHYLFFEDDD
ncbi:MAG: hypothetical protein KDD10_24375, partial [Phaeodactylibacter sp.]|nr:hypothetical protein [Phaeodactylibacter sp.]